MQVPSAVQAAAERGVKRLSTSRLERWGERLGFTDSTSITHMHKWGEGLDILRQIDEIAQREEDGDTRAIVALARAAVPPSPTKSSTCNVAARHRAGDACC